MSDNFFGKNIRSVRKYLGMNQGEFAECLGISGAYISDLEKGKGTPSEPVLRLMTYCYRINRTFIETGEGEMLLPENQISLPWQKEKSVRGDPAPESVNEKTEEYSQNDEEKTLIKNYWQASDEAKWKARMILAESAIQVRGREQEGAGRGSKQSA